jgi:hypothetical protein
MEYCNVYSIKSILQAICTNHLYCYCLIIFLHKTTFIFGLNSDSYPKLVALFYLTVVTHNNLTCILAGEGYLYREGERLRQQDKAAMGKKPRTSAKHKRNFARISVSHMN